MKAKKEINIENARENESNTEAHGDEETERHREEQAERD